jgi:predicted Zn-ribbon and HTH transcriptional regulator
VVDTRLERIGRLAGLARGLEREGVYNGAKLARAALERELLLHAQAADVGYAALGDAVAATRADLEEEYPVSFMRSLAAAETAAREGTTLSIDEAPPVRTCRVCGELFVGEEPPSACPVCEAPDVSLREHLPVWYLEPAEPGMVLAALGAGRIRVEAALAGREDAALARPPAPGEWSVRETLEHLLYAEELLAERLRRLLSEDDPDLAARAVWAETPASDEGSVRSGEPASVLLARYRATRDGSLALLAGIGEAEWARAGRHAEWGPVTVLSQAAYFARHEASHLAQLVAAAEGRVPGQHR